MNCTRWVILPFLVLSGITASARLVYTFDHYSMQGWHNRVWSENEEGEGAWVDLPPGCYRVPATINNRCIYPATFPTENTLFCSSKDAYPFDWGGRDSYLTPVARGYNEWWESPLNTGGLDSGTNTKWVRSPRFRITESGDLVFHIIWGRNDAEANPTYDYLVPPVALVSRGWTGVCLCEAETGRFVCCQKGTQTYNGTYVNCRFTEEQMRSAGVTADKVYTLDLITMRAGAESWIALDDVTIPGVLDASENPILWDFSGGTFDGWRNCVWDGALNRWVDLGVGETVCPVTINDGAIWPTTASDNSLFISTADRWPGDRDGYGSRLTPDGLDSGSNTKWIRSPAFYITGTNDLSFDLFWGPESSGTLPLYASQVMCLGAVRNVAWAGVSLRDADSGRILFAASGSNDGQSIPFRRVFTAEQLSTLDKSHAYILDLITMRSGSESWVALDNVSVPGRLTTEFLTSFSVNGTDLVPASDMVYIAPRDVDITRLAPTFTLGEDATCDVPSGTVRDFTTPQAYTVTLSSGETHTYRLSVSVDISLPPVTEGLVYHLSADVGVVTAGENAAVKKWCARLGGTDLFPGVASNPPTLSEHATPLGKPAICFVNEFSLDNNGLAGQALGGNGAFALPSGTANRTVFVFERFKYATPPQNHGWGGFSYGATPNNHQVRGGFAYGSVFGLVSTLVETQVEEQTLAISGWGAGLDFEMPDAKPGNEWICHSATLSNDGGVLTLKSYLNGIEKLSRTDVAYDTGNTTIAVGMEIDGAPFQNMDVCEILVYDRVLTGRERMAVESYLRRHWMSDGTVLMVQ